MSKKNNQKEDSVTLLVNKAMKIARLNPTDEQKNLIAQIFKFVIVGGIATVIDWFIYFVFCHFIHLNPLISNIIAFGISVIYNYWASCKYVFNVTNKDSKTKQLIVFLVLATIGLGITEALIFIFNTKLAWNYLLVKILATIIVMIFNFVTRKIYLEKK